jgi:nucleoside phosphorylase
MKTLLVDDSPEKVTEVTELLKSAQGADHVLDIARSGLEARERLAKVQYDLLVLDIKLPFRTEEEPDRKGGINLLTEITLSGRFFRPTHVVALTGFDDLRKEFDSKFNNGQWTTDTYDPSDAGWRERLTAKASYIARSIEQTGRHYETDLCVITALDSPELDAIRSLSWDWSHPEALDSVSFLYRGQYKSENRTFSAVATASPRMGMVATATMAQKLIHHLRPRMLAMTGICAGVRGTCEIGDVLFADPCWDWQMGKYLREVFQIQPDQIAPPLEITQRVLLLQQDRKLLIQLVENFKGEKPNSIPNLIRGPVASGSSVLADSAIAEGIKEQHRKLVGVDMELYGLFSAGRDSSAPKPMTFGFKGVCDFADHLKNDKYQKYSAYISAEIMRSFAERFSRELIGQELSASVSK